MSAHDYIEQDNSHPEGGNELPTYDDLAAQNGPNSRFGRWKGWIEKRAAERYADITPEERQRRRERGWGNDEPTLQPAPPPQINVQNTSRGSPSEALATGPAATLHIQTNNLSLGDSSPTSSKDDTSSVVPLPYISQPILPSHLKINHFGSRFLPHTTAPIRCVLPVMADRMLLIGHDEGLSVLNLFPQEWNENGEIITKGPGEAECRPIWIGECVYQMSILEMEETAIGTPQGVVLAVVGPSSDSAAYGKDAEAPRAARMYNLASLISLARWAISQKGSKPVDLHKAVGTQMPQTPSKRHRPRESIAKSIKSFMEPQPSAEPAQTPTSYSTFLSPTSSTGPSFTKPLPPSPSRQSSSDSSWDVVDDIPLRWATDFVPLASPGSRLAGASVITFATWSDENRKGKGGAGQLLAIASKSNIFLYETPRGERAYRFVKEFYTPMQPRAITFIHQAVSESRSSVDTSPGRHSHRRSDSGGGLKGVVNSASSTTPLSYGTHLSLFVIFEKKAGWIRLADSAVGEVELGEDGGPQPPGLLHARDTFSSTSSASTLRQRARLSFDIREAAAKWIPPSRCDLPVVDHPGSLTRPVLFLTRGKRTHILPSPLQTQTTSTPPLNAIFWKSHPRYVSARIVHPDPFGNGTNPHYRTSIGPFSTVSTANNEPLLQLTAFTDAGLEVQELTLGFMNTKGKSRAFPDDIVRAEEDLGGDTGFLSTGGHWDRFEELYGGLTGAVGGAQPAGSPPTRHPSLMSKMSMDSTDFVTRLKLEEGVYGWCRKGLEDWRVFWVGGNQAPSGSDTNGSEREDEDDMYW